MDDRFQTIAEYKAQVNDTAREAANFLRVRGLMPDNDSTDQIVRLVLYGIAVNGWQLARTIQTEPAGKE